MSQAVQQPRVLSHPDRDATAGASYPPDTVGQRRLIGELSVSLRGLWDIWTLGR